MARARNIKPSIFQNEVLGTQDPLLTLLFQSLWCLADREGRLEDRPLRIKAQTFPYRDLPDFNRYLTVLEQLGFIERYEAGGLKVIQVCKFKEHQSPHVTEKQSDLPAKPAQALESIEKKDFNVKATLNNGEVTAALPPDSLIPDSLLLIPDSPNPDSPNPEKNLSDADRIGRLAVAKKSKLKPEPQGVSSKTFEAYADAYERRYGLRPPRNKQVSSMLCKLVEHVGAETAPLVARFYVTHPYRQYILKRHPVNLLLLDYQTILTDMQTGDRTTDSQARLHDKEAGIADAFAGMRRKALQNEKTVEMVDD